MKNFYIDENKVFSFSEKKGKLVCLGELIGETANQLYCRSLRVSFGVFCYDKRFKKGGYSIMYPQIYRDLKMCLSKYNKSFKSILRPIDEYYKKAV